MNLDLHQGNTQNEINENDDKRWDKIDDRQIPQWFDDAKFGIFVHWGLYSVPAWGPKRSSVNVSGEAYAEWYGWAMNKEESQYWQFHKKTYGEKFKYEDFAPMFKGELFDPDRWSELFQKSGARYVLLTAKHHDAFCLWPSEYRCNWNSMDIGIHRDVLGELTEAVRKKGMKMGAYYSLLEWFNPLYIKDPERYAVEYMLPQMKELVSKYNLSILFTDGEWEHNSKVLHSCEFLEWLYNESCVRDEVVVNDRWGAETRGIHGGYFTTEYGEVGYGPDGTELKMSRERKWEEDRGIGTSFGYNRNENLEDYLSEKEVIHLLIDTVSKGGNLLLNVGPTADGSIPVIMEERLLQIGEWLKINGEAIYKTTKWRVTGEGEFVKYTSNKEAVFAICLQLPRNELILNSPQIAGDVDIQMFGCNRLIEYTVVDGKLRIKVPEMSFNELQCKHAYVFQIRGVK